MAASGQAAAGAGGGEVEGVEVAGWGLRRLGENEEECPEAGVG
jgi:hypothetical protein